MKNLLQRVLSPVVAISLVFAFTAFNANASDEPPIVIDIDVAPNVLNIQSNSTVVTVHTNIPYSAVDSSSVLLNGVLIDWWKSDNQGNFVAKFVSDEVKELVDDGMLETGEIFLTLTLIGNTTAGDQFNGTQTIWVINNLPKGKK